MDILDQGKVVHEGSFNNNLMSTAAYYASLNYICNGGNEFYNKLNGKSFKLMEGLR